MVALLVHAARTASATRFLLFGTEDHMSGMYNELLWVAAHVQFDTKILSLRDFPALVVCSHVLTDVFNAALRFA